MTIDSICTTQQFFLHTQRVGKLWVLDYVIGTPSNHRVHHGSNEEYLDKNYGAFLMIWDHLFGTFTSETIPVKYGLTTGEVSYSFFNLVFGYWIYLIQRIKSGGNFVKILFGRPSK
jgi:sterol desaturase/sphingolipid hydroxylase (fatty acid hydroxylase superfamily)